MRFGIARRISGALALAMGVLALTLWFSFDRFRLFQSGFERIARHQLADLWAASELEQATARLLALTPDVLQPRGDYLFSNIKRLVADSSADALALTTRLADDGSEETRRLGDRYRVLADQLLRLVGLVEEQQGLRVRIERLYRRLGGLQLELIGGGGIGVDVAEIDAEWRITQLRPLARLFAVRESTQVELIRREGATFEQESAAAGAALEAWPDTAQETARLIHDEVRTYGTGAEGLFSLRAREADLAREITRRLDEGRLATEALLAATRALHLRTREATEAEEAAIRRGLEQIGASFLLLAGLGVAAFAAIHLFVRRSVTRRILRLQQAIHANAGGAHQTVPIDGEDELGQMAREVNFFLDEIARREAALRAAATQAEAANRAKGEFLANISHEIRTPMNSILNLTALSLQGPLKGRERGLLEKVEHSSAFLLALINELLDFSRIESGRLELEEAPFAPGELIDALEVFAEEARQKGLHFQVRMAEGLPPGLVGDALRIQQVLRNLVGNAIKFTHEGRVEVAIEPLPPPGSAAAGSDRVWLEVAVTDSGIGIPSALLEGVFEPFSQADSSTTRLYGGTGLGLAISRRLAERMGGSLTVQSTPQVGSRFTLHLPLRRCEEGAPLARRRGQMAAVPREGLAPLRGRLVLLVEDNEFNQVVATELLERAGIEADLALDGQEAVEMAAREAYELVLMDLQMPRMDGYEAARAIRALGGRGEMPIIALTANALPETLGRCRAAGMDDLVTKPIAPVQFYERLLQWLAPGAEVEPAAPAADPAFFDLFRLHYQEAPAHIEALRGEGEREAAARLFHNLKSAAGTIGAHRLQGLAAEVEQVLLAPGPWPEGPVDGVVRELERVLGGLTLPG